MSNLYLPVFEHMRANSESGAIEVSKSGESYSRLVDFNGIETDKLVARAKEQDAENYVECLRQNLVQFSVEARRKQAGKEEPLTQDDVKTHLGFKATIEARNGRTKAVRLMAASAKDYADKKKLVTQMFEAALTAGARMGLSPEEIGEAFASKAMPDGDLGDVCTHTAMGLQMEQQQKMAQAMQAQMMGGMMGGPGGPRGGGPGGPGGPMGGPPPGAECQQQ